jgi:predicted neuraminidase
MPKTLRVLLIAVVLALHGVSWRGGAPASPRFIVAPPAPAAIGTDATPYFHEELIEPHPATKSSHVASICDLPGGRLAAAWYAGEREGAPDVAIVLAMHDGGRAGAWSPPRVVVNGETAGRELGRHVRKVANAVLFADARGTLWLLYESLAIGGSVGSSLNCKSSPDGGVTWTPSRRLTLNPFFNLGEMVKNKPAPLEGGGWAVPIYHEFIARFPEILWLRPDGEEMDATKTRVFGGCHSYQPALAPLTAESGILLCRAGGSFALICSTRTDDGGQHWSAPQSSGLPNPDAGVDVIRLTDGRLLMAFNDSRTTRDNLRLAISRDNGQSWQRAATLAADKGYLGVSYPFLLQTSDGDIHVVYSVRKEAIRHAVFNLAWLAAQMQSPHEPR